MARSGLWRKAHTVPPEHGSWLWWLGPFAIGLAAGGTPGGDTAALFVAALAGFLLKQPATVAVKVLARRRPPEDMKPALVWMAIYAAVAAAAVPSLLAHGHARILWLLVPGAGMFAWHLALVARRTERRRMGVEILAGCVLALAGPAAYWVAGGRAYPEPWVLWALCSLHTAASIANVYLRLDQRLWPSLPPLAARLRAGRATLLWHVAGLAAAAGFAAVHHAPWAATVPFAVVLVDGVDAALRPCVGARPAKVGIRQMVVMLVFVALMIAAWR